MPTQTKGFFDDLWENLQTAAAWAGIQTINDTSGVQVQVGPSSQSIDRATTGMYLLAGVIIIGVLYFALKKK